MIFSAVNPKINALNENHRPAAFVDFIFRIKQHHETTIIFLQLFYYRRNVFTAMGLG